jgi:D-alanyl-D-alanine carboxypeptidase/D-alanyl-D-alanine-endopeptidase (penicillin-binding protein 4)
LTAGIVLALSVICGQASATRPQAPGPVAGPDVAARTPYATPGSAAASKRPLSGKALRRKLDNLIDSAGSASGAFVYDVGKGRRVFADAGGKPRILASNTKLFTTSTALERLGANDRLETRVYADGRLEDGVLDGDLYLVGDGDPALASKDFAAANGLPLTPFGHLSKQIKAAGVERVSGRIYADDSIFDRVRGVPDSGGETSIYVGPLSGLNYNSGLVSGGFASDPALVAAKVLKDDLDRRGIGVGGGVELGDAPGPVRDTEPLALVESPPVSTLIEETNHVSNNFFAEMLLKRLGATGGKQGTTKRGSHLVEDFMRTLGVEMNASDGSGLTRSNTAAPKEVGELLAAMLKQPFAEAFFDSLPVVGQEGTVAARMGGTAAAGFCRAKTGTLTDVSALSGYCGDGNRAIVFSILNNSVSPTTARSIQDQMVALIARYGS